MTKTIQNTSLALEKVPKQVKTPGSLYTSDENNSKHLARYIKVTNTTENASLAS